MKQLKVETIFAKSPQAKGRVERFNRTFQDRLVKALRRKGISNIAEANKYLQSEFISEFNKQFSILTTQADVHRSAEGIKLEDIFCYKTTRQVRNDYTINLAGGYIQLLTGEFPLPRPKQNVTVSKWLNGTMHINYNDQELNYNILKSKPKKKGYKKDPAPRDHPWRRMNRKISSDKQKNFFAAVFG